DNPRGGSETGGTRPAQAGQAGVQQGRGERRLRASVTRPVRAFSLGSTTRDERLKEIDGMAVFVLDRRKQPLMPCSEKRARLLLARGRARVHRLHPFTIRLVDRTVA